MVEHAFSTGQQVLLTPITTGDGSSTFYSNAFGEWFHNRAGACHEAQQTYVEASKLVQRVQKNGAVRILDICYGLGYNTAAALDAIGAVNASCEVEIKALEIDVEVARSAIAQNLLSAYSPATQQVLSSLVQPMCEACDRQNYHNLNIELLIGDARHTIQPLVAQGWQADIIFLDPFSPPNCPQLWTVEFLQLVARCLNPTDGILVTYSCSAAVRAAIVLSDLSIGTLKTTARKYPGTIACHTDSQEIINLSPLSQQEKEHLQTRAAVPYRDPTLQANAEDILQRRVEEQTLSNLVPTKPWRRRWAKHMRKSPYLVDAAWLVQQLGPVEGPSEDSGPSKVVVIDTRFSLPEPDLGRRQYVAGHIPGAYYLDLNQDLSSEVQAHGGRHPLPNWDTFVARLNQLGIHSAAPNQEPTRVVIYDDSRFAFAARLWWMLRYLGHEQVAILDGGIKSWESAGYPLSTDMPEAKIGGFIPRFQEDWIVDIEMVRQRKDLEKVTVVDSRSPERYRGEVEPIDPVAGSIPGAINAFWQQITDESGQIKSTSELKEHWSHIEPDSEAIVYCGSGVTACVNLFSLVVAGHSMHKLYPGGWSDWCTHIEQTTDKKQV